MIVIGLLSTEDEANELQFIAKVCTVNDRIRFLVQYDRLKHIVKKEQ